MNTAQATYKRQMGFGLDKNYDVALKRLKVHSSDNWKGIIPPQNNPAAVQLPPIYSAKFCGQSGYQQFLALADEDGKVAILDTDRNSRTELKTLVGHQCHDNAICDIAWTPGQQKLISSSSDFQSRLWDVGPTDLTLIRTFKGHSRSVKVVTYRPEDGNVFATGGRDGAILVWDTRVSQNTDLINRAENSIFRGHDHETKALTPSTASSSSGRRNANLHHNGSHLPNACKSSITGLSFQDDNTLISCGAGDGIIKVWDLRRNYSCYKKEPLPKHSLPYAGSSTFKGFTNITMDLDRYRLYVSCMDNTIYCYNVATYNPEPIQRYNGLKNGSYYIRTCLSADGKYLISGSSDDKAYIWNVERPLPIITLDAHEVEVSCVAWGRTKDLRLVTSSDDASLKIWRVAPSELSNDEKQLYHGEARLNEANRLLTSQALDGTGGADVWSSKKAQTFATPTLRRTAMKRTFAELADSAGNSSAGTSKKRARRLFSDAEQGEEASCSSPLKQLKFSPLTERLALNDMMPCTPSSSNRIALTFNSPTSNLPNFVLNGEAPHLPIISPKRKLKENIDWLTKIRKQKLLHSPSLQHVLEEGGGSSSSVTASPGSSRSVRQGSPRTVGRMESPRTRCTERSNSTSHTDSVLNPKTPSSSRKRRNSTTTPTSSDVSIRRFLHARTPVTPHPGPSSSK